MLVFVRSGSFISTEHHVDERRWRVGVRQCVGVDGRGEKVGNGLAGGCPDGVGHGREERQPCGAARDHAGHNEQGKGAHACETFKADFFTKVLLIETYS